MDNIIEINRMAVKEQFRHFPLMDIKLEHLRTSNDDKDSVYLLIDGPEFWQQKYIGLEIEDEEENNTFSI